MKVLFVCTGNICRSPMGELMFPLFFHDDSIVSRRHLPHDPRFACG